MSDDTTMTLSIILSSIFIFFIIFLIWSEIGVGNILFRPNEYGNITFIPIGWIPLFISPFKYKKFWNSDLILFNPYIMFILFILGIKFI